VGELPAVSSVKLHRPHTVLVVDDDAAVRNLSLTLLRRCGFLTLEAFDGQSGLSIFQRHQTDVDLVLTDVVMPNVSGPQMVEKILASNPSVKVVFMSGTSEIGSLPNRYGKEFPIIYKPFGADKLTTIVRECLEP
jgi:two-component system cell cycle sensor histidine kinase/response regulator CckA